VEQLDENTPEELKEKFNNKTLTLTDLIDNPEWIKYLKGYNEYIKEYCITQEDYKNWSIFVRQFRDIPSIVDSYMSYLYEDKLREDIIGRQFIRPKALTDLFKKRNQDIVFDDLDLDVQAILERDFSLKEKCEKLMPYKDVLRGKKVHLKFDSVYDKFFEFCESIDVAFDLAIKYGGTYIKSIKDWNLDDENKNLTKKEQFRKIVYKNIEKHYMGSREFMPEDFKQEYPELFLTEEEMTKINGDSVFTMGNDTDFYIGQLDVKVLQSDKNVAEILRHKNVRAAMRSDYDWVIDLCGGDADKFIDIALEYGGVLNNHTLQWLARQYVYRDNDRTNQNLDIIEFIDDVIYTCIIKDDIQYNGDSVSERFRRKHPELFLLPEEMEALREEEKRAPKKTAGGYRESEIIENEFYKGQMDFKDLRDNKALREIIKNKNLVKCMSLGGNAEEFINRFAEVLAGDREKAIDLASTRFSTQLDALLARIVGRQNIDKILTYYKEMRFIPHHAVVRKFPIERVKDFALNSKLWGKLMENPEYNKSSDAIGSLLEAAMVMGVFETKEFVKNGQVMVQGAGQEGFEKLQELLNYAPEYYSPDKSLIEDTSKLQELGMGYIKDKTDYNEELIYQTIERAAKEEEIYDDLLQGEIDRDGLARIKHIINCDLGFTDPVDDCFRFIDEDKFECIIERDMESKIKVLFATLGLKNDKVLSQDEFAMLKMAGKDYILRAFEDTKDGYYFNMKEIDGKFVIGDNINIDEEVSKKNKKLFDYIKFLMMEYGLEEEGARLAANNDRSKIDLVLNKNQMKKILDAADKISLRAQGKYVKGEIFRLTEEAREDVKVFDEGVLHGIFDGFDMTYNKEFRDFIVENIEDIVYDEVLRRKMNSIQKKIISISKDPDFAETKITAELVLRLLSETEYMDKKVGFEKGEELASKFGFSQGYFIEAQDIWDEARKRDASSIPRVIRQEEKYSYEVLRLDDATGIFAGNITDCCQKVGGVGESAMLHSMKEKSGRVFVVRDEAKKIIAQAWLWRNGNTICFDNVEMPKKSDSHENQTAVHDILKKVAKELCDKDSEVIDRLVKEGKIEKEKADVLKAKKVTVGKGNTDINAIRYNYDESIEDKENKEPVQESDYYLYTSDSEEQVILYQAEDYISSDYSMNIHRDENIEKECKDVTALDIKTMEAIECEMDEQNSIDYKDVRTSTDLAKMYGVDEDKLKLVIGTDWFMLYSEDENSIEVHKMLRSSSSGILKKSIREQRDAVKMIIEKAQNGNKSIGMNIEYDRVYEVAMRMIEHTKKDYEMDVTEEETEIGHRIEISGLEGR